MLTTPGCCLGTTRRCRSRSTSTPRGESAVLPCTLQPWALLPEPLGRGKGGVCAVPPSCALPWHRRGLETLPVNVSFAEGCREPRCQRYSRAELVGAVGAADVVVVCLGTGRSEPPRGSAPLPCPSALPRLGLRGCPLAVPTQGRMWRRRQGTGVTCPCRATSWSCCRTQCRRVGAQCGPAW